MIRTFNEANHAGLCDQLAIIDADLKKIIDEYGYPPVWSRPPGFASLIHIILEQQVSLASAKAAFVKLKDYIGDISPENLLRLNDTEMKACYFSRQKTSYARELANAILTKKVNLDQLNDADENKIRQHLKQVKGIGDWTVDIYLLFVLKRCDIFPLGDLAMVNALKIVKGLEGRTTKDELLAMTEHWRPYRSVATYLLWHYYIRKKGIKLS
jgi:DNA-3-methyladenine glycosylase II